MALRRRRRRRGNLRSDWRTAGLAAVAAGTLAAVVVVEFGRVWKRGSAPMPAESDSAVMAAIDAATETAEVAVVGYREVSKRENAMFNLLSAFVITLVVARTIAHGLRTRGNVGPFRNMVVGRRHIHHFVPGIVIAFLSGGAAIVSRDDRLEPWLAIPFGIGAGLTLDESALLLELDDVYWTEEGVLGVQISLGATAILALTALASRFLRRGEQVVLDGPVRPG